MSLDREKRQASRTGMWHSRPRLRGKPCATAPLGFVERLHSRSRLCNIRNPVAAMTLIEILVVMGIISLIVGAIAVASFAASRKAQIKNTEALLEKLAQGLAQYRQDYRMFVPSDNQGRTYPLWRALDGEYAVGIEAKYKYSIDGDTYTDTRTGQAVQRYLYQDAWKMQLRYLCDPPYQHFTIASTGPDLEDGGGDDIEKAE